MSAALETIGLVKRFGGLLATDHVSFRLETGARHALIGPNGAGKTTFVNQLSGVLPPTEGRILLAGQDVTRMRPDRRVRRGMARTFQVNQLFPPLTPLQTIAASVSERLGHGLTWWRGLGRDRSIGAVVEEIATRFGLVDVLEARTAALPYGKQRLLEIATAFASRPRVLLLDEPAAGVPEAERHEILTAVSSLPNDVSVLLIEHDMDLVFTFASRITVMVNGAVFAEGDAETIAADPRVRAVYLGDSLDG